MRYLIKILNAVSQLANTIIGGDPNESLSGRSHREWPSAKVIINKIFFTQDDHCKDAYLNDLKWAKLYIIRDAKSNEVQI